MPLEYEPELTYGLINRGTSAAYRVARLKRDHPGIAARLAASEFNSVSAAERAAGVATYQPMSKLEKI